MAARQWAEDERTASQNSRRLAPVPAHLACITVREPRVNDEFLMASHNSKTTLFQRLAKPRTLDIAWRSVKRGSSRASFGPDGISRDEFERSWPDQKKQLLDELKEGRFQAGRYRGQPIPKSRDAPPGDPKFHRPISIANIRDRVVQRALLDVMWTSVRDSVVSEVSFGGVRRYKVGKAKFESSDEKKNVQTAARAIVEHRNAGFNWVFETDIEKFFPTINRERLMRQLRTLLPDNSVEPLLGAYLSTEITNAESLGTLASLWDPTAGVPQGGVLSPCLANLYLHPLDQVVCQAGLKMVRFVDDLIVLCKSKQEAESAHKLIEQIVTVDLGLKMHPLHAVTSGRTKTAIRGPEEQFDFLGLTFTKNTIRPMPIKIQNLRAKIIQITDFHHNSNLNLIQVIQNLNWVVEGWIHAYDYCNLSHAEIRSEIDQLVTSRLGAWLQHFGISRSSNIIPLERADRIGLRLASKHFIQPLIKDSQA